MFGDIGLSELLVIAFVIIVVTKPEDLPVLMRRLGIITAHVQRFIRGIWVVGRKNLGCLGIQLMKRLYETRKSKFYVSCPYSTAL